MSVSKLVLFRFSLCKKEHFTRLVVNNLQYSEVSTLYKHIYTVGFNTNSLHHYFRSLILPGNFLTSVLLTLNRSILFLSSGYSYSCWCWGGRGDNSLEDDMWRILFVYSSSMYLIKKYYFEKKIIK